MMADEASDMTLKELQYAVRKARNEKKRRR